jgi:hypothetical protein
MTTSIHTPEPRAQAVRCTDAELVVTFDDGRVLSVPLAWFPRLAQATTVERSKIELLGGGKGIHWPALDEDLSVAGLLAGRPNVARHAA